MLGHFLVDGVVFRDKEFQTLQETFKLPDNRGAVVYRRRFDAHGQMEANCRPFAFLAGQADITALQLQQLLADSQSKACPAELAADVGARLFKGVKYGSEIF